ncbi:hypothetical protein E4633_05070 [Geomonas terrae]|uniref:DUF5723 domain-containing protein n=1 Tax=Geomonas terrae TaxID=2562681 RepID=A0A4S1CM44_9BACT|nr:hypothetical protein [Geomonas terrae]TGU74834.1 hypothetical protein E4633_05070 [Geomonas terrae]
MNHALQGGRKASLFLPPLRAAALTCCITIILAASQAWGAVPMSGFNPALLVGHKDGAFLEASAFAADTVLPVMSIIDDNWNGRFTPKEHNLADLYWYAGSGVVARNWRVAAFNRGELFVDSNRDSIEFIYSVKKKLDLTKGRRYQADIRMRGWTASGVEVSRGASLDAVLPGLSAGLTLRVMMPHYLQYGSMSGAVTATGSKSYDYDLYLDYAYGHNILYRVEDETLGSGYGYSADLGASYRRGGWHAELLVRDLAGALMWDSVPYTKAYAVNPTSTTAPNGYQDFTPSISGYEGKKSLRQTIPVKTDLSLGYDYGSLSAGGTCIFVQGRPRTWLSADYRFGTVADLSLAYNIDYAAFSLAVASHGFKVGATLSDPNPRDARALGAELSYLYSW